MSIVELGRRVFGAAACSLAVIEPDDEHLVFRAGCGAGADQVIGVRLPVARGIAGWVVSSGQPIAVRDVRTDPRFAADVAESTGYVPRSILAAPLTALGEPVGVLEVLDRTSAEDGEDMELLALLAAQAALAVELTARAATSAGPDPEAVFAEVGRLGEEERRAAAALLNGFLGYLGRSGGSAGLV
jgi:GAF domain-containing protein